MDEFLTAAKFAVTGVLVGAATATVTDLVSQAVMKAVALPGTSTDKAGQLGRQAFSVVLSAALGAGGMLAGDKVMNKLVVSTDDPLFRVFYFNTAFLSSATVMGSVRGARTLFGSVGQTLMGKIPHGTTDPLDPSKHHPQQGGGSQGCGGCSGGKPCAGCSKAQK